MDGTISIPAWWIIVGLAVQMAGLALTVFIAYHKAIFWLGERLHHFETMLATHAQQLITGVEDMRTLTVRLEKTEQRHFDLAQTLQRLIGEMDVVRTWNGRERRQGGDGA